MPSIKKKKNVALGFELATHGLALFILNARKVRKKLYYREFILIVVVNSRLLLVPVVGNLFTFSELKLTSTTDPLTSELMD